MRSDAALLGGIAQAAEAPERPPTPSHVFLKTIALRDFKVNPPPRYVVAKMRGHASISGFAERARIVLPANPAMRLRIHVRDPAERPAAGVSVRFSGPDREWADTDRDGAAEFAGRSAGRYRAAVFAVGFVDCESREVLGGGLGTGAVRAPGARNPDDRPVCRR